MSLGMVSVLTTAAYLVSQKELSVLLFPVSVMLAATIFAPIVEVTTIARSIGVMFAAGERVFSILHAPAPVVDKVERGPEGEIEPTIDFENVGFRYDSTGAYALKNVSFSVKSGETVALVGHSGAGKSTCTQLLLRFWDVAEGRITIGGHDIRAFPQSSLRDLMAFVP
jgi:ABC-type multidrug transport system fused ATPase/permease subunit